MVLEITHCDNCFNLKGQLTRISLPVFIKTFHNIFERQDELVLNIEEVNAIDRQGVRAIAQLHNQSINKNKKFVIVGYGNRDLYQEFSNDNAA